MVSQLLVNLYFRYLIMKSYNLIIQLIEIDHLSHPCYLAIIYLIKYIINHQIISKFILSSFNYEKLLLIYDVLVTRSLTQ